MLTPWIRSFNYIDDYFNTLYKIYAEAYIACYPVTYYSLDMQHSVGDTDELLSGSYEKLGVGPLSGYKFKKISMFPIYGIDQLRLNQTSNEKGGITYGDGLLTKAVFPSIYGLIPLENDILDLSFGYNSPVTKTKMLFVVSSVNIAHQGDYFQIYQIDLKPAPILKENLDKQISEYLYFYEFSKMILPESNVYTLLKIYDMYNKNSDKINNMFDKKIGFYTIGR